MGVEEVFVVEGLAAQELELTHKLAAEAHHALLQGDSAHFLHVFVRTLSTLHSKQVGIHTIPDFCRDWCARTAPPSVCLQFTTGHCLLSATSLHSVTLL